MACPCTRTSLAEQRRKKRRVAAPKRRRARQVSAYDIKTGSVMSPAMAGKISAYKLDGSRQAANTYSNAFSFSPYTAQVVTPVAAATPSSPTVGAPAATVAVAATPAAVAAAQRRKRRRTTVKRRTTAAPRRRVRR